MHSFVYVGLGLPEGVERGAVNEGYHAVQVKFKNGLRQGICKLFETLLAVAQGLLSLEPLGYIADDGDIVQALPCGPGTGRNFISKFGAVFSFAKAVQYASLKSRKILPLQCLQALLFDLVVALRNVWEISDGQDRAQHKNV